MSVGDFSLDRIEKILDTQIAGWEASGESGIKLAIDVQPDRTSRVIIVDNDNVSQTYFYSGRLTDRRGTEDLFDLIRGNANFGLGMGARINVELRENRGLTYGMAGRVVPLREQVVYTIYGAVEADRTGEAVTVLREMMTEFRAEGFSEEEVSRLKALGTLELPAAFSTPSQQLFLMGQDALFDQPVDNPRSWLDRYNTLTKEVIDDAVGPAINPDDFAWVLVGDAETIAPQLVDLGLPVEVIRE